MLAVWMVYALLTAAVVHAATALLERSIRGTGWPTRWLWLGSIVLGLVLPLLTLMPDSATSPRYSTGGGPRVEQPALNAAQTLEPGVGGDVLPYVMSMLRGSIEIVPSVALQKVSSILTLLWLSITLFGLAWITCTELWLARHLARCGRHEVAGHDVLVSKTLGPAVVGVRRSRIVLPEWVLECDSRSRDLIVAHEAQHIRGGDPLLLRLALVLVLLAPWNLVLWHALRRLRLAAEIDCDARVMRIGPDRLAYGQLLLRVGERASLRYSPLPSFAVRGSQLASRIERLSVHQRRAPLTSIAVHAACSLLLLLIASSAPAPVAADAATHGVPSGLPRSVDPGVEMTRERLRMIAQTRYPELFTQERSSEVLIRMLLDRDGGVVRVDRVAGPIETPLSHRQAIAPLLHGTRSSRGGLQLISVSGPRVVAAWAVADMAASSRTEAGR